MRGFRSTSISISSISLVLILILPPAAFSQKEGRGDETSLFKRRIVSEVVLDGVRSFPQSDIRKILYTKPNHWYNLLKKRRLSKTNVNIDVEVIKRFYSRRGYLSTDVRSEIINLEENKAGVTFHVAEGTRTYLSSVKLEGGLESVNRKFNRTLNSFELNKPIDAGEVTSGGYKIRDIYFDEGYPYATIRSDYYFDNTGAWVAAVYVIAESVYTVNNSTRILTRGLTRPHVVLREVVAKPGKKYSQKNVVESEQRLYSTGLFKFVNLRRNDSTATIVNDTCHVGFNLSYNERKPYFINFGLGLGNQENFDLVLRSYGQWGIGNIAGTARKVVVGVRPYFQVTDAKGNLSTLHLSDLGRRLKFTIIRSTFEVNYITPWAFVYRVPVSVKAYYEPYTLNPLPEKPYRYDRVAAEAVFSFELDRFTTTRLTANTEYINIRNVPPDEEQAYRELGDNRTRRRLSLYGERDTRDNIFVPQKGSYSFAGIDYVGGVLKGDFSYRKLQFSWSRYNPVTGQNILATRLWLGWLDDRFKGGLSAPDDRFIIGGATTIRGYTEKSIGPQIKEEPLAGPSGGRYLLIGNIEIRRPLFWRFGGTAFLDAGNTYDRYKEITPISIKFTTGMGLQFFTPIGPIRFDYGVRMQKQFDLGAGLYHLSILYAF